jgi:hypothetical protein
MTDKSSGEIYKQSISEIIKICEDLLVAPAPGDDASDEGGGPQVQLEPLVRCTGPNKLSGTGCTLQLMYN